MKARTSAGKLRAKRGRPKIDVPFREPNGRASRAKEPPDKLGLETRARRLGITVVDAKDQMAGSFLGVLALRGPIDGISGAQYRGALDFIDLRNDFLKAVKAPNALVDRGAGGSSGDLITDSYVEWCRDTRDTYEEVRNIIQEAQNADRSVNLWAAIDLCLVQDMRMEHMLADVRCLCNVFVRYFKTDGGNGGRIRAIRT